MTEATLTEIRQLVENGRYSLGEHTQLHMMEEGFDKEHCVGAIMGGRLLETYPIQRRYLIAGRFHLSARNTCPLHIVCEIAHEPLAIVRFVTAYIPRPPDWISPHVRARRQTKWK